MNVLPLSKPRPALTALFATLLFCIAPIAAIGQTLVLEPEALEFGDVRQKDVKTIDIHITNEGDAFLRIIEVKPSCGCTAAKPEKDNLRPGESIVMPVTFDTQGFMGPQHKYIKFVTNDPSRPEMLIDVHANVIVPLLFEPPYKSVNLGKVPTGETSTSESWVSSPDVEQLEIRPVSHDESLYTVEILDSLSGDPAAKILRFTMLPTVPIGHFRDVITFESNVPDVPTFDMDVAGTVQARVRVSPDNLRLRYLARGRTCNRAVTVKIAGDASVARAEIDLPGFEVGDIQKLGDSNDYMVAISGVPVATTSPEAKATRGRMKGTLTIYLDGGDTPMIEVPVTYMLRM